MKMKITILSFFVISAVLGSTYVYVTPPSIENKIQKFIDQFFWKFIGLCNKPLAITVILVIFQQFFKIFFESRNPFVKICEGEGFKLKENFCKTKFSVLIEN